MSTILRDLGFSPTASTGRPTHNTWQDYGTLGNWTVSGGEDVIDISKQQRNLLVLLFFFYFPFFLGCMLSSFLLFSLAFVFTSFVTHACSSFHPFIDYSQYTNILSFKKVYKYST